MSLNAYTITDAPHPFSSRIEALRQSTVARMKPNRVREGTFTGPEPNGIAPFLDAFESRPDAPYAICLAEGIVRSWLDSPIVVRAGELLLGVSRPNLPLYEHFSWGIKFEPAHLESAAYRSQKQRYLARYEALKPRIHPLDWSHVAVAGAEMFGSEAAFASTLGTLWDVAGYQGHTIPGHVRLLALGLDGLIAEIEAAKRLDPILFEACAIAFRGMSAWMERYAEAANRLADCEPDSVQRALYRRAADNCRHAAHRAPDTFEQAAQLLWSYALWDWVDCLGRPDQYLYPFYVRADDPSSALHELWLKFLEHGVHNITVGGQRPDGTDATNELSFAMLEALRSLRETHPRMSIRVHEGTPGPLLELAVKMWSEGMSDPTLVNDDVIIAGFTHYGVDIREARQYSMCACQEVELPGKSNMGNEDGVFNLAKCVEYALNDGRDRLTGRQIGPRTGLLKDFACFDQVMAAYRTQVEALVPRFVDLCNLGVEIRLANHAKLVKTPLTEACLARGLDLDDGGAVYNFGMVETCGLAAAADALMGVKLAVYEQGACTPAALDAALQVNFAGHQALRQRLIAAPKFGNDIPGVDRMAASIADHFWTEIGRYRSQRGGAFYGACSLLESGIRFGQAMAAMPDGSLAGAPLGNSIGPRPGANKQGLTAMLNSVAKLPLQKAIGGATCNVSIPTALLRTAEHRRKIAALMRTYFRRGGQMAQITAVDPETLRAAQQRPDQYEHLIVRVGGFSIRFVELSETAQDEIIARH